MTNQRILRLRRQLQESRFRLLNRDYDFARPLIDMVFVATEDVQRFSTNGKCIFFDPNWLQKAQPLALDFSLVHQLMHLQLNHIDRPALFKGDRFHLACDIIANSKLRALGWNYEKVPQIGIIYHETFFPRTEGSQLTPEEAMAMIPFDPATLPPVARRRYMIDSEQWWDRKDDTGESGVIVLSPTDEDPDDLHLTDYRKIKTPFTPKFAPPMLPVISLPSQEESDETPLPESTVQVSWDISAADSLLDLRDIKRRSEQQSLEQTTDNRIWQRTNDPSIDWRKLLDVFLQEEICDYSFSPPDRRFQDSDFFLPDFNDSACSPKEILFMVDTSGSVSDNMLSAVYTEICGAIEQFVGSIQGLLGFFDSRVYSPRPFSSIEDLLNIVPAGGGGTDYFCVFDFLRKHFSHVPPACLVIITDGEAAFPDESAAMNTPVLWLFTKKDVSAPWGKSACITSVQQTSP